MTKGCYLCITLKQTIMTTPLAVWASIVALLVILFMVKLIASVKHASHRRIIELGSERDEFFVPGDPIPQQFNVNDYTND